LNIRRPTIKINKTWLMLIIAILLSLLTTWLTVQYLRAREHSMETDFKARSEQGKGAMIAVVVPTRALPPGMLLSEGVVAARSVPADFVYPDTITVAQFDAFKGHALIRSAERGKPLRRGDVREMFADFAGSLKPGKRAMTINVDEVNSVSHMVEPGNLVDLMLVVSGGGEGSASNQTVAPFLDQIKVLATGQKVTQDSPEAQAAGTRRTFTNLTLEVTPTQAARLALALELGKIRAVLRNATDMQSVNFETVSAANIMDDIRESQRRAAAARPLRAPVTTALSPGRSGSGKYVEYIIGGKGHDAVAPAINVQLPAGAEIVPSATPSTTAAPAAAMPAQGFSAQTLSDLIKLSTGAKPASTK
jgi:pilus assembly protein CpaB